VSVAHFDPRSARSQPEDPGKLRVERRLDIDEEIQQAVRFDAATAAEKRVARS
jgi:hypothetical protein